MAGKVVAEAIQLISSMPQNVIKDAYLVAFRSPSPPISPRIIQRSIEEWKRPDAQLQLLLMGEPSFQQYTTIPQLQHHHTYEDGTQAFIRVNDVLEPKFGFFSRQKTDTFFQGINRLDTQTEASRKIDKLMKAAVKCKIKADLLLRTGTPENTVKAAATPCPIKTEVFRGAGLSTYPDGYID